MARGSFGRRHLVAVALLVALLAAEATVLSLLPSGETAAELPPNRVGDQGTYDLSYTGAWENSTEQPSWVAFRWGEVEPFMDRAGTWQEAHPMDWWTEEEQWRFFLDGSGGLLAWQTLTEDGLWTKTQYRATGTGCPWILPMQGRAHDLDEGLELDGCAWPGDLDDPWDWTPADPEPLSVASLSEHGRRLDLQGPRTALTLEAGLAMPTAVTIDARADDRAMHWDLIGFSPGEGAPVVQPDLGEVADPDAAPLRPWGPEDTGVDWAWAPRDAYAQALQSPAWPDLREFQEDQPDAFPIRAAYSVQGPKHVDGVPAWEQWRFEYQHDDGVWAFSAKRLQGTDIVTYEVRSPLLGITGGPVEEAVTWQAARQRLEALAPGHGEDPVALQWQLLPDDCPTCARQIVTGRMVATEADGPGGTESEDVDFTIAPDGSLLSTTHRTLQGGPTQWEPIQRITGSGTGPASFTSPDTGTPERGDVLLVTGIGAIAVILWGAWPFIRHGPIGALFTRINAQQALDHPVRTRLLTLITESPGIRFTALREATGASVGVLSHHLRKLEQTDHVTAIRQSSFTAYFPHGEVDHRIIRAAPAMRNDTAREILAAIQASPGCSMRDAAERAGVSHALAHYHVQRLRKNGVVTAEKEGKRLGLRPAPWVAELGDDGGTG